MSKMQIEYLYVRQFRWYDVMSSEIHHGHLREGHVYRCVHNLDAKSYLINYDPKNCLLTDKLLVTEMDDGAFSCDLVPITRNNILEFSLKEEDLDSILRMEAKGHKDILDLNIGNATPVLDNFFSSMAPPTQVIEGIMRGFQAQEKEDMDFAAMITAKMLKLLRINSMQVDALNDVIDALIAINMDDTPRELTESLSLSTQGSGYNLGKAVEHLQMYMSSDRKLSYDYNDLTMAITALIDEQVRRIYNEDI